MTADAMHTPDLIIRNCSELLTLRGASASPKVGDALGDPGLIDDGAVAVRGGKICWIGKSDELGSEIPIRGVKVIDAGGKVVMPGFVDPHTHLVFAGSREREWLERLGGKDYIGILKKGGGIMSTVRATREATESELTVHGLERLRGMLSLGTTTVEAKSGYGLTTRDEAKILRVMHRLSRLQQVDIVPTFLGAHAVPSESKDGASYVRLLVKEMIPAISRMGLAEYCDVFCEDGAFTAEESMEVLKCGARHGLKPKMHANEFSDIGGLEVAAAVRARSIDHLDVVPKRGMGQIRRSGAVAVLAPGVPFFMGSEKYADARGMISAGIPVALATDFNPGTCFCYSMPFIISLACIKMRMSPEQAICATTINAAHAIGRAGAVGSIEVGKRADIVILGVESYRQLPYSVAGRVIDTVIKGGRVYSAR